MSLRVPSCQTSVDGGSGMIASAKANVASEGAKWKVEALQEDLGLEMGLKADGGFPSVKS